MPLTFPAHQGLIFPVVHRWPGYFDALALSVGAAMPDISDSVLGFLLNGYFKQWYGHALIGIFAFDLPGGLLITWLIGVLAARFLPHTSSNSHIATVRSMVLSRRTRSSLWSFSVLVGILSHLSFDLISHDTNLLLYPWYENARFPEWWYTTWFKVRPLPMFGKSYSVGVFTIIWGLLSLLGVFWFVRFLIPKRKNKV